MNIRAYLRQWSTSGIATVRSYSCWPNLLSHSLRPIRHYCRSKTTSFSILTLSRKLKTYRMSNKRLLSLSALSSSNNFSHTSKTYLICVTKRTTWRERKDLMVMRQGLKAGWMRSITWSRRAWGCRSLSRVQYIFAWRKMRISSASIERQPPNSPECLPTMETSILLETYKSMMTDRACRLEVLVWVLVHWDMWQDKIIQVWFVVSIVLITLVQCAQMPLRVAWKTMHQREFTLDCLAVLT